MELKGKEVVFLGDSITEGVGADAWLSAKPVFPPPPFPLLSRVSQGVQGEWSPPPCGSWCPGGGEHAVFLGHPWD